MFLTSCRGILRAALLAAAAGSLGLSGFSGMAEAQASFSADAPAIMYFGRWQKGDVARCGQSACYLRARFTGTSLRAMLAGDAGIWWRVSIDGGDFVRFAPDASGVSVLAEHLRPGTHTVLLVRSTEGEQGLSEFRGFLVDDGASLLPPVEETPSDKLKRHAFSLREEDKDKAFRRAGAKARRLEFVGDSITAGAFNDRDEGGSYHDIEDGDRAYGPRLARALDADYSIIAKSGEGIAHNYDEDTLPYTGIHTADRYPGTFCQTDEPKDNPAWDASLFPVDAVIVAMGTNDLLPEKPHASEEAFVAGYVRLLSVIRRVNPDAKIICLEPVPAYAGPVATPWIEAAIRAREKAGDKGLYFLRLNADGPLLSEEDYAGDGTHPLDSGHEKIAAYLEKPVAKILGWDR
jgi:lysophospholipase L1-like esterase